MFLICQSIYILKAYSIPYTLRKIIFGQNTKFSNFDSIPFLLKFSFLLKIKHGLFDVKTLQFLLKLI